MGVIAGTCLAGVMYCECGFELGLEFVGERLIWVMENRTIYTWQL